ncbi:MAG: DUF6498-containing protein [Thermoanaerobaculia bacterium]
MVAGHGAGDLLGRGVLVALFVSLRIVLHRRWTRKRGHWRTPDFSRGGGNPQPRPIAPLGSGSLLAGYLGVVVPFTLAHGLFLGLLLFLFLPREFGAAAGVSLADLGKGTTGVLAFLVLGLALDLVSLGERPFRWIELVAQRAMGRIFVVHMTILFGMAAVAWLHAPSALFAVFAGFKTLLDLGIAFPPRELSLTPPRWAKYLDRLKHADGEDFSTWWRRTETAAAALRADNELRFEEGTP